MSFVMSELYVISDIEQFFILLTRIMMIAMRMMTMVTMSETIETSLMQMVGSSPPVKLEWEMMMVIVMVMLMMIIVMMVTMMMQIMMMPIVMMIRMKW